MIIIKDIQRNRVIIASEDYSVVSGYIHKLKQSKIECIEKPFNKNLKSNDSYCKQILDQNVMKLRQIKSLEEIERIGKYISNSCTTDYISICEFETLTTDKYIVSYLDNYNLGVI